MSDEDETGSNNVSPTYFPSHKRNAPATTAYGNRVGRPLGSLNKNRGEAKSFCLDILRSDEYRRSVQVRAKLGTLPPAVETLLWHYAYGKPVEHVAVTTAANADLSDMSAEQLAERASFIASVLKETASARAAAIALDRAIEDEAHGAGLIDMPSADQAH
jgi:hypothetical protein